MASAPDLDPSPFLDAKYPSNWTNTVRLEGWMQKPSHNVPFLPSHVLRAPDLLLTTMQGKLRPLFLVRDLRES